MTLHAIERLLAEHIGLDAESVGHELIARAVHDRQKSSGALGPDAYLALLASSRAELQALIEAVVVSETWFFRDAAAFATLAREATGPWLAANASPTLRVLSLPCATGEEPYSIALALIDAGFPPGRLEIDGADVSEQALVRARRGVYGNNAFRGNDSSFRERHFEPVPLGHRLRDDVRAVVSFRKANLLDADVTLGMGQYAAIFCRNVLIYLDRASQRRALDVLARLLGAGGLLFVGPSETSLVPHDFLPLHVPQAFGFRKAAAVRPDASQAAPRLVRRATRPLAPATPRALPRQIPSARRPPSPSPNPTATRDTAPASTRSSAARGLTAAVAEPCDADEHLELVARLADRGELGEAARRCADHERQYGSSARLFYLMGLLREAQGELDQAAAYHKKALYLEPQHEGALTHLALLLDKQGDSAGAERLRQRARRLGAQEPA
jgi:chemotaxis protein methyltransferase WspC